MVRRLEHDVVGNCTSKTSTVCLDVMIWLFPSERPTDPNDSSRACPRSSVLDQRSK